MKTELFRRSIPMTLVLAVLLALSLAGESCPTDDDDDSVAEPDVERQSMILHVKTGTDQSETPEAHAVLMALTQAWKQAEAGRTVLVHFDLEGVQAAMADTNLSYTSFLDSEELFEMLFTFDNVRVQACPGCVAALGCDISQLREGIQVGSPDSWWEFTEGRTITLDY
jgi:hypothetical protein